MAYDCILWNSGPELCATQVKDQSFFFIDEDIDPRLAREKECTAVISVIAGHATGKDTERQFMNVLGSETWRWTARPIGENKFVMRFPNAKMVKEWSFFPFLAMRYVNAQMKIEAYTTSFGAKESYTKHGSEYGTFPLTKDQ